jgi:hypothetical protein
MSEGGKYKAIPEKGQVQTLSAVSDVLFKMKQRLGRFAPQNTIDSRQPSLYYILSVSVCLGFGFKAVAVKT